MPRRTPRTRDEASAPRPAKRTKMVGHPTGVEDEAKVARMIQAIEAGVPIKQAAHHAGLSPTVHFRAMDAGEQAQALHDDGTDLTDRQESYRQYRDRVLRARSAVAVIHVALVAKAAQGGQLIEETRRRYKDPESGEMVSEVRRKYAIGDWRASRFLLQASFRTDFAGEQRAIRAEVTGPGGGPIEVGSDEVLKSIAERLASVRNTQERQLPGGWEPGTSPYDNGHVIEGEAG
jgi:hypothetical protein